MSEIYLTKVERKTIFTEGLIFVLFTVLITDLSIVGPYIFTLIPWIFFLGIFGTVKFRQPILTPFIVFATSFMAGLFKYDGFNKYGIINSVSMLVLTIIGVGVGEILKDFVLEHRLVKYLKLNRKIVYIALIIIALIVTFGVYIFLNGDIVGFLKAKGKLQDVMDECFLPEYETVSTNHLYGFTNRYMFEVLVDTQTVYLYFDGADVNEVNETKRQEKLNIKINEEIQKLAFNSNVKASYEFEALKLYPKNIVWEITSDNENNIESIISDIRNCINYSDGFGANCSTIILTIAGKTQVIEQKDFDILTEEYIINGMQMEELDSL